MLKNNKSKSIISILLIICMIMSFIPSAFAAQSNEYVDPADSWLPSNNRTNEFDINATTTNETYYCLVCDKDTTFIAYRVPEYTKSGETALNRSVQYSDGTCMDGKSKGNLDSGTPGVNAYYTGYHWTKIVCQTCGTINGANGAISYGFSNNVYVLNSCDTAFFLDFDATTYEQYDEDEHITTLKRGEYCQFCKGTFARASEGLEEHDFTQTVEAQIGHNRFCVSETCSDCGYKKYEYVTAKSVVTSYYGVEDGEAHTLTVSDLSDNGVRTSIRYGTSAESCTKTSAPNYTEAGYYTVYYEIDYAYSGEVMTENGVSYVWLVNENDDKTIIVLPSNQSHEHDYHYLETIAPSCVELGYDRFQCNGCGDLTKTNYTPAKGHNHKAINIREATCERKGQVVWLCSSCGDFYEVETELSDHKYVSERHNATCRNVGYTEYTCEVCGDNYINNIQPLVSHSYERVTKEPTCTDKGYTTSTCTMCGYNYVDDYTDALGHSWDEGRTVTHSTCVGEGVMEYTCLNDCGEKLILATDPNGHTPGAEATCTHPQVCLVCDTTIEYAMGHNYDSVTTEPTCTAMGYTTYTCINCDDSYVADYVDKTDHDYEKDVTEPTCTEHGYTTYTCDCGRSYESDYVDAVPHNYDEEVTNPTCTTMGFTTFTCYDCDSRYVGSYVDMTEHNYNKQTVEPTCTEHGYAVYTCPDCGKSYMADYTESIKHTYTETVVEPTCLEMGYTIYNCECGDTYKGDYKEAYGHLPSEWIVDAPATIEGAGRKHIECTRCGETLYSTELPQLIDKDNSDEDGKAEVGDYTIILTDENGKPIFNSELTIDVDDNVSVKLTNGRLLDFEKPTTITATYTETKKPKENLKIYIEDENGNKAIGYTNADGVLIVPNNKTNTNDDNGTIGKEDGETKETFVITVTDKANVIIPDCDVYIGESNNVVVDLPEGIKPTRENPVIVTITDHNGEAQEGVTVIALGDADFIEKGKTDMYGKITLPTSADGYTDEEGHVNVNELNVLVNDELGAIVDAYVRYNDDNTITVTLPDEKKISYANRITVTVTDSIGGAVMDKSITVQDIDGATYTSLTDENGKIVVPPLNTDMTDENGEATVNGHKVLLEDEVGPIADAYVEIVDGKINITLSENIVFDYTNRITATVTDGENSPVKDMSVMFTDAEGKSETNLTDENGKASVPPVYMDYTDVNGYSEVDGFIVTVVNEIGAIEKAFVTHNAEVKDENGTVKSAENITVLLPEGNVFDYEKRITVTVQNKADKVPVKDMIVIITEAPAKGEDETEEPVAKTLTDKTDANGKAVFPPLNEDITDGEGSSGVEETPEDKEEATEYKVLVNDTKDVITDALVKVENGKVTVTLPETHTLTTSNQTTVTVTDSADKAVKGVSVTVKDKSTSKTGTTDANGKVTLPVKTSSGGGGGSSSGGGGGGSYYGGGGISSYTTTNIKVVDKGGKSVSISRTTNANGDITLTLPSGKTVDAENYYTITVTDNSGKAKADVKITLKDRNGKSAEGKTDSKGIVILPGVTHTAYVFGYPNGEFRPDGDMLRSKAAAIFARLIAERKGEDISGRATFTDVKTSAWYYSYVGYLEDYDVIRGYTDNTFRPDEPVSRAEFVAMTVRYYDIFEDVSKTGYTVNYSDVSSRYWAYNDIAFAKNIGWLNGYADGTFKGDNNITRAEVVTVTNHATERTPDEDYINKNVSTLNKFTDLKNNSHWAYYDIMEAANTHIGAVSDKDESWVE